MIRVAANMNAAYVIILAIALLVLCGFGSSFERCQKVEKRVRGVCPFYNKTTSGPHFDHIADTEDSAIFHFVMYWLFTAFSNFGLLCFISILFSTPFSCFVALPTCLFFCLCCLQPCFYFASPTMARVS